MDLEEKQTCHQMGSHSTKQGRDKQTTAPSPVLSLQPAAHCRAAPLQATVSAYALRRARVALGPSLH